MPKLKLDRNTLIAIASFILIIVIVIAAILVSKLNNKPATTSTSNSNVEFSVANPYTAPELTGITSWINSDGLQLKDLKGKVVLIDFWTYSCINCIRSIPVLKEWYSKYKDQGLVVIGVHSPEFAFEKVKSNVEDFVKENGIQYPVVMDNDYGTWNAFQNQYWPAEYIIDKNGNVRHTHFGEGEYSKTETVIQTLLNETNNNVPVGKVDTSHDNVPFNSNQTAETYLGYERGSNFANSDQAKADEVKDFTDPGDLQAGEWSLSGKWETDAEAIVTNDNNAKLKLNFSAKNVYLVMGSDTPIDVTVKLNGEIVKPGTSAGEDVTTEGVVHVSKYQLYRIINSATFLSNNTLELDFPAGVKLNAFTFGG